MLKRKKINFKKKKKLHHFIKIYLKKHNLKKNDLLKMIDSILGCRFVEFNQFKENKNINENKINIISENDNINNINNNNVENVLSRLENENIKIITDEELCKIDFKYSTLIYPHIHTLYRRPCSCYIHCFKSCFEKNNECINFWTHFLGGFVYLIFLYIWIKKSSNKSLTELIVVSIYLISAILTYFISSIFHMFISHSSQIAHNYQCLDWSCLTSIMFSSLLLSSYYEFYQKKYYKWFIFIFIINIALFIYTIYSINNSLQENQHTKEHLKYEESKLSYFFRAFVCIIYGLGSLIPITINTFFNKISLKGQYTKLFTIFLGYFFYSAVFFNILSIPEKWFVGKFDFIGYSHQIFHIGALLGTYFIKLSYVNIFS